MNISSDAKLSETAGAGTKAARVRDEAGVDHWCGGQRTSQGTCASGGASEQKMLEQLRNNESAVTAEDTKWMSAPLCDLTRHIRETHHRYVREAIRRIQPLAGNVKGKHGDRHAEISDIEQAFLQLSREMIMHMQKEEQILFPYIDVLELAVESKGFVEPPFFQTVRNPVQAMMKEHDSADQLAQQIRTLTQDYTLPPDACGSFQSLYDELRAFEADLHQHVHLENDILFPRAVKLESQVF